jgi:putative flippase GtrA
MRIKEYFHILLFGKSSNWILQLFRYFWVGGFAFIIDYLLLYFFTEHIKLHYLISATISFMVGLLVNYLLSIKWIFNSSKYDSRSFEFTIFGIIGVIGLGLNAILLWIATDLLNIYYMLSKLFVALIIMFWNFFCRKIVLFNK